jgi:hypothetical protein
MRTRVPGGNSSPLHLRHLPDGPNASILIPSAAQSIHWLAEAPGRPNINVPGIPSSKIEPCGMVKDLDVIKFDSFAFNVLLGALRLQQSGHSESATNQVLKSTHAYLNSIRMESLFRIL